MQAVMMVVVAHVFCVAFIMYYEDDALMMRYALGTNRPAAFRPSQDVCAVHYILAVDVFVRSI